MTTLGNLERGFEFSEIASVVHFCFTREKQYMSGLTRDGQRGFPFSTWKTSEMFLKFSKSYYFHL